MPWALNFADFKSETLNYNESTNDNPTWKSYQSCGVSIYLYSADTDHTFKDYSVVDIVSEKEWYYGMIEKGVITFETGFNLCTDIDCTYD